MPMGISSPSSGKNKLPTHSEKVAAAVDKLATVRACPPGASKCHLHHFNSGLAEDQWFSILRSQRKELLIAAYKIAYSVINCHAMR